jgi:uncharacterized membrane protein
VFITIHEFSVAINTLPVNLLYQEIYMDDKDLLQTHKIFTKSRTLSLTDSIFAFSMTLLVTTIAVPKSIAGISDATMDTMIVNVFPEVIHYFLSFILLAIFWWSHHERYHHIRHVDRVLIWLNMSCLVFVALLPFSTDFIGNFPFNNHVALIFELNLLLIGFCTYGQWIYTSNDQVLGSTLSDELFVSSHRNKVLIFPVLSFIAIVLALFNVSYSVLVYLAVPFYMIVVDRIKWT